MSFISCEHVFIIPKQIITKQNNTSELLEFTDNMIASAYWLLSGGCFCSELGVYSTAYNKHQSFTLFVQWKGEGLRDADLRKAL